MHPTPLRGPKIAAILKAGIGSTAFSIYHGGAGDAQAIGRLATLVMWQQVEQGADRSEHIWKLVAHAPGSWHMPLARGTLFATRVGVAQSARLP
jgi:hypothetical protein